MVLIEAGLKTYYVPVENSDEFIETLIERVNDYRQQHNMKEL